MLAALQRLPVSLRVPVVLRYYADLSERDIALAIGRRPGTVKSRLHEARRRLAEDPGICSSRASGPRRPGGGLTCRCSTTSSSACCCTKRATPSPSRAAGASAILGRIDGDDDERSRDGGPPATRRPAQTPARRRDKHRDKHETGPATRSVARTVRSHGPRPQVCSSAAAVLIVLLVAAGALRLGARCPRSTGRNECGAGHLLDRRHRVRGPHRRPISVGRISVGRVGAPVGARRQRRRRRPRGLHVVGRRDVHGRARRTRRARRRRGRATGPDRTDRFARSDAWPGAPFRTR